MGAPSVGDIVLVPFPFSDLSGTKNRPALLLADAGRDDWVCLQVTSQPYGDEAAIILTDEDFARGTPRRVSYTRPGKLFTALAASWSATWLALTRRNSPRPESRSLL